MNRYYGVLLMYEYIVFLDDYIIGLKLEQSYSLLNP